MALSHSAYGIVTQGLWHYHIRAYLTNRHKWRHDVKNRRQPKNCKYCKYCNGRRFFANAKPPTDRPKTYRSTAKNAVGD